MKVLKKARHKKVKQTLVDGRQPFPKNNLDLTLF